MNRSLSHKLRQLRHGLWLGASLLVSLVTPVQGATLPSGFTETTIASGLSGPTAVTRAPDGRFFVCEEGGRVRIVKNNALLPTPFITLSTSTDGERGVLGIAFDPDFATNRFVYIYYTATSPNIHNRISRFTASATNPDLVQSGSEMVLMDLPSAGNINHNGGDLHFGPDGKLYIAVGDHQNSSNSPSLTSRFGKILRINKDGTIPSDNPFLSQTTGANQSIWARGLRNPYRFSFQPGTGRMFINDVGDATREEINEGGAGRNYGWPQCEGSCSVSGMTNPVHHYAVQRPNVCAITSSVFYNPQTNTFGSAYAGRYFYTDFCAGWIRFINPTSPATSSGFATGIDDPVDLEIDPQGNMYYLARGHGGVLRKISGPGGPGCTIGWVTHPSVPPTVPPGQPLTLSVSTSSNCTVSYQWQRANPDSTSFVNISGATSASYTFTPTLADDGASYRAVASATGTTTNSNSVTLNVANCTPPTISSVTVTPSSVKAGDTVTFSGSASADVPVANYSWNIEIIHDAHTHPLRQVSGVTSGTFTVPTLFHGDGTIRYRATLTVTNGCGATATGSAIADPRMVPVTLATNPAGLQLTLDGSPRAAGPLPPQIEGITRTIGAPSGQSANGQTWDFSSWSDGGAQTHDVTIPAGSVTYTATFVPGTGPVDAKLPITSVTATADDGNVPANAIDGNLATRWSASGNPQSITFNLGSSKRVAFVKIAFYNGNVRTSTFDIQTSTNGTTFTNVRTGVVSSGTSTALETFDITDTNATHVRIVGHGNSVNLWNSYTEVEIWGGSGGPTPTTVTFEAEAGSPVGIGAATSSVSEAAASGGVWQALTADGVGDAIEFTTPTVPAGTYQLRYRQKIHPNRGIGQVSVDGVNLGSPLDQYSASPSYTEVTVGTVTFAAAGTHKIRITVTGKNASSTMFNIGSDRFSLVGQ